MGGVTKGGFCSLPRPNQHHPPTLPQNAIRNNFVLVYELLDEAIDAGWPQTTDEAALRALVFEKGFVTAAARARRDAAAAAATLQVTGAVGWRRDGIKYKKNEVFLDVVETVSCEGREG